MQAGIALSCVGQCFVGSHSGWWRAAAHPVVHMHEWLVAHEQCPHELQCGDLQWEVEWCDEGHRAVRPAHTVAGLAWVVTRHTEATGKEAHLQSSRVQCRQCRRQQRQGYSCFSVLLHLPRLARKCSCLQPDVVTAPLMQHEIISCTPPPTYTAKKPPSQPGPQPLCGTGPYCR